MNNAKNRPRHSPPIFRWSKCDPARAPKNKYIVERLIRARGANLVLSSPKKGKSQLAAHLVACALSGKPVFGAYGVDAADLKILLLLTEENRYRVRERIVSNLLGFGLSKTKVRALGKHIEQRLFISARDKSSTRNVQDMVFSVEHHSEWLLDEARGGTYDIIVLDSLRPAHSREENSSTEMKPVTDLMREVSDYACALIVHHEGHAFAASPRLGGDAARGTSDLDAARDTAVHILDGKFGKKMVIGFHHRDAPELFVALQTTVDRKSGAVTWTLLGESDDPSEARRLMMEGGVLERVDAAQQPEGLPSLSDARRILGDSCRDVIDSWTAEGIIEERPLRTKRAGAPSKRLMRPGQFTEKQWAAAEKRLGGDP